jgi:hypothetical protein
VPPYLHGAAVGDTVWLSFEFDDGNAIERRLREPIVREYLRAIPSSLLYRA